MNWSCFIRGPNQTPKAPRWDWGKTIGNRVSCLEVSLKTLWLFLSKILSATNIFQLKDTERIAHLSSLLNSYEYEIILKEAIPGKPRLTWHLFKLNDIAFLMRAFCHLKKVWGTVRIELSAISWWVSDIFWRIYDHGISCCTSLPFNISPFKYRWGLKDRASSKQRSEPSRGDGARMDSESKNQGFVNPLARLYLYSRTMFVWLKSNSQGKMLRKKSWLDSVQ